MKKNLGPLLAAAVAAASGCGGDDGGGPKERILLDKTDALVRASMSLQGKRPTLDELHRVKDDPRSFEAIVDGYLETAGFAEMIRDLHNEALTARTGAAIYPAGFPAIGPLADMDVQRINVSVTDAPLRLIEHVVMNDRPYTEIVTADYTVADEVVAEVWGLPYEGSGPSWEQTRYQDGRAHAGVLSDSWLFTRHSTTSSNKNRGRANVISRALLCNDFISRQLEVDSSINLADEDEVADAVVANPACASCHQTLDPLASYFGSFHPIYVASDIEEYPFEFFVPELGDFYTVRSPAYFGYGGGDVAHLGKMIAEDPRFSLCAATRFFAYFHQVPLEEVPRQRAAELQAVLLDGWSAKKLAKAIVLADDFQISHIESADPALDANAMFKIRPWQLARTIDDLTGFRWEAFLEVDFGVGRIGRINLLTDSFFGFEVLAGGIDSQNVTIPAHTMTATTSLVLHELASQAAEKVVEDDAKFPSTAKLLGGRAPSESEESFVRRKIVELHLRLYGSFVETDSPETTAAYQLFRDVLAHGGDPKRAWKTLIFTMLQDFRMAYY